MTSIRQNKVNRLLQKELGNIFQTESMQLLPGKMITVTHIMVSPDLGAAKVYISIFPSDDKTADLKLIQSKTSLIRGLLGKSVGKQLRVVPEIFIYLDDSLDYVEKIEDIFKNLGGEK